MKRRVGGSQSLPKKRRKNFRYDEPRQRARGAKKFSSRMLPKIRLLLAAGYDDRQIAMHMGINTETLHEWADRSQLLRNALSERPKQGLWEDTRSLQLVQTLVSHAVSDVDIARIFDVSTRTFARWRRVHPLLEAAIARGIERQFEIAEKSLLWRATGYFYDEELMVRTSDGLVKVCAEKFRQPCPQAVLKLLRLDDPDKWAV